MAELKPILLVEDNPKDLELTLAALEQSQLANEVVVVRDGAEALDFLYRRGAHASRNTSDPAVVLLDLKLPKVDGLEVLEKVKADPALRHTPGRHADLVAGGERSRAQLRARRQRLRGQAGGLPRVLRRDPGPRRVLGHPQRTAAAAQRSLGAPMDRASANHPDRALRILLLEDSALDAELVTEALLEADLRIALERVVSAEEFTDAIHGGHWDLILADYLLPAFDGLNALDIARRIRFRDALRLRLRGARRRGRRRGAQTRRDRLRAQGQARAAAAHRPAGARGGARARREAAGAGCAPEIARRTHGAPARARSSGEEQSPASAFADRHRDRARRRTSRCAKCSGA